MAEETKIQWTDATWNVARGCTKVDADCKFCYMYRDGERFKYDAKDVVRTKTVFNLPLKLKEPSKIFTSSLTDFFHPEIDSYRDEAWDIIRRCPHHTFQILTKRPERIAKCLPPDWGEGWANVWLGTSVGSQESIHRAHILSAIPSKVRFLSLEPLFGPINLWPMLNLTIEMRTGEPGSAFDWVIVGGESGNETGKYRYRPCDIEWIQEIVDQCKQHDVPVFVKQLGTYLSKQLRLSDRHGGNIEEFPIGLRVRQFPKDLRHVQ